MTQGYSYSSLTTLDASDIEKFRKQLVTTEFKKLSDRTSVSDGEDNRLSKIFVVDDVFFQHNINFLTRGSVLRVSSSGPGGIQNVGVIALEDTGGLRKGEFGLKQREAALQIGQLRFSSVVTGRTPVSSGTGGGTPSTPSTPSTPGGEDETGEGETGEGETGEGETGEGETGDQPSGPTRRPT